MDFVCDTIAEIFSCMYMYIIMFFVFVLCLPWLAMADKRAIFEPEPFEKI